MSSSSSSSSSGLDLEGTEARGPSGVASSRAGRDPQCTFRAAKKALRPHTACSHCSHCSPRISALVPETGRGGAVSPLIGHRLENGNPSRVEPWPQCTQRTQCSWAVLPGKKACEDGSPPPHTGRVGAGRAFRGLIRRDKRTALQHGGRASGCLRAVPAPFTAVPDERIVVAICEPRRRVAASSSREASGTAREITLKNSMQRKLFKNIFSKKTL